MITLAKWISDKYILRDTLEQQAQLWSQKQKRSSILLLMHIFMYFTDQEILLGLSIHNTLFL